jgi:hypothetical protein
MGTRHTVTVVFRAVAHPGAMQSLRVIGCLALLLRYNNKVYRKE